MVLSIRTPLARVRGLGSAKKGVAHFWQQRLTAVALIPLAVWMLWGLIAHAGADYAEARAWLGQPVTAILLLLLVLAGFHHMRLGLEVVIEDYVHDEGVRLALVLLNVLAAYGLGIACAFAALKLSLGA